MVFSLNMVLKQQQKLIMTPQMQQSLRLLQLTTMQLEQLTRQEMLENPLLEMTEDEESSTEEDIKEVPRENVEQESETKENIEISTPSNDEPQTPDFLKEGTFDQVDVNWDEVYEDSGNKVYYQVSSDENKTDFTEYTPSRISLYDDLIRQLKIFNVDDEKKRIGEYLIGNIDDDGYLKIEIEEAAAHLQKNFKEVEDVLINVIQSFDPDGVGARNLEECLLIQLKYKGVKDELTFQVIRNFFRELQKKKFSEIAQKVKVDRKKILDIFHLISKLEPKPGRTKSKEEIHYVTPDVFVKKIDGQYMYYINEGESAHLKINSYYKNLLLKGNNGLSSEERDYTTSKYKAAVWLIKNIEKRRSTIIKITKTIMEYQKEFLERGIHYLKPLTLKYIADIVGMHESTVQRVTTGKYVDTPRGIYELKFFFSSGIGQEEKSDVSSISIKQLIKNIIREEDPAHPLSDQKIADSLKKEGMQIARRTVAKYREKIKLLPARMRKLAS